MSELYPLVQGLTLYYACVDYRRTEPAVSRLVTRVEDVVPWRESATIAKIRRIADGAPEDRVTVISGADGVKVDGRLELRFPVIRGSEWEVDNDPFPFRTVLGVGLKVSVVDREFDGCVEIGFTNRDTDSGSRFYAPGVGLVKEVWHGETYESVLSLVDVRKP